MNTSISILMVVRLEGRKDSQLYSRSISILLDGPDDLDCNKLISFLVLGLHDLTKGALAEKLCY
jgi:hypothetical protein